MNRAAPQREASRRSPYDLGQPHNLTQKEMTRPPPPSRPPPRCPVECRGRFNELDRLTPPRLGRSSLSVLPATPRRLFAEETPPVVVSNALPRDTMLLCLSFLDVTIHTTLSTVSKDWPSLSGEDALWRDHYLNRFSGGTDEGDGETSADEYEDYKQEYKQRLEDPHVGDDVEVAWRGKFRLESLEIYRGTAWWVAVVVDKVALDASSGSPGRGRKIHAAKAWYKVTFPGWEGRWDEWVSRDRLRWRAKNTQEADALKPRDFVEVWCGSQNVPGAWLEASVQKIRGDAVEVGRVLSTGSLWVDRSRVRRARSSSSRKPKPAGFLARSWRFVSYPFRAFRRRVGA